MCHILLHALLPDLALGAYTVYTINRLLHGLCSFHIEGLSPEHETQQSGAESNTGFSSAQAIRTAVHAGATCIGRTNTPEAALGYANAPHASSLHCPVLVHTESHTVLTSSDWALAHLCKVVIELVRIVTG